MSEELTYLDFLVLRKLDAESTVERFGTHINTSFFETANVLGTMKIKGLLDIQSSIGGQSPLVITGTGQDVLATAMQKAAEPLDALDHAILKAIGAGARDLGGLQGQINIRSPDLAFHLHKLKSQDFIDQEIRSAKVMLSLTEKGFISAGGATWRPASANGASVPASPVGGPASPTLASSGTSNPPATSVNVPASAVLNAPKDIQDILSGMTKPAPPAQKPSSDGLAGSAPSNLPKQVQQSHQSTLASASAAKTAPMQKPAPVATPEEPATPEQLKAAMRASKMNYVIKTYLPYALLVVLLLIFIVFAFVSGMNRPMVA